MRRDIGILNLIIMVNNMNQKYIKSAWKWKKWNIWIASTGTHAEPTHTHTHTLSVVSLKKQINDTQVVGENGMKVYQEIDVHNIKIRNKL